MVDIRIDEAAIARDVGKVKAALTAAAVLLSRELAKTTGEAVAESIRVRTRKGTDIQGRGFAAYADSTIKQKAREGRATAPVNLVDTGDMLASIKYRKTGKSAGEVAVGEEHREQAEAHQKGNRAGGLPQRRFMGLSRVDSKKIGGLVGVITTVSIRSKRGDSFTVQGKGFVGNDADILVVENP